jgi:hypothetical protein
MTAGDLLKTMRDQIDRLFETSPAVPPVIVSAFKELYGENKDISRPEIANGIDPIEIYQETKVVNRDALATLPAVSIRMVE